MKTPLHTLEGLEHSIAETPAQPRTGARFLNLDTRVLEWLIHDARELARIENDTNAVQSGH